MQRQRGTTENGKGRMNGIASLLLVLALTVVKTGCVGVAGGGGNPPAVTISNPAASNISSTGATITWSTNVPADSQVDYGTTPSYGQSSALNPALVTSHSVALSGLTPATLYYYRVKSKDSAGRLATSGDTFTTASGGNPPVISGVTATNISTTGATVSWITDKLADSQVDYGTTTSYGSSTPLDSNLVTTHSQGLSGLTPGTPYHYRVKSKDGAGNQAVSGDFTFSTLPDNTPPVISGVSASPGSTTALIFWTTDKPADSQVDYGTTASYGQSSALDSTPVTSHAVSLSGLTATTPYHYRVKSRSSNGLLATSGDNTFTTMTAGSTSLSALAAQMQPGTWAELTTNGFFDAAGVNILSTPANGGNILEYANEATWDPVSRQLFFLGSSHHSIFIPKFVSYSDATNVWAQLSYPGFDVVHGYNHQALDPTTETYYHRPYNSSSVYKYDVRNGTWGQIPDIPWTSTALIPCCAALEYFPEMRRLVFVNGRGNGELYLYDAVANSWTVRAPLGIAMGEIHNLAQYLPVSRLLIFGGGDFSLFYGGGPRLLYKLDASGTVTQIPNPPIDVGITAAIMTADPVTGKLLIFGVNGGSYEYDPGANAWMQLTIPPHPLRDRYGNLASVAVPIPNYGVVLFVKADDNLSKVYLYKHR